MITGQYVKIEPTVASVGDRIFAQLIDWLVLLAYLWLVIWFNDAIDFKFTWLAIVTIGIVPLFYTLAMEIFNQGRSIGKMAMKMQVTMLDGSTPTLGAYLMRWLLYIVDGPMMSFVGLVVMILTRNNQRLGDLAAGTVVIKKEKYRKIQISLDEYDYLQKNYTPRYPQAADLSLEQIEMISRTVAGGQRELDLRRAALARKVEEKLAIKRQEPNDQLFLKRILRDYQYYALEEI